MNAKALQKRNHRAENLRVLQTDDGSYYVESSEGKILYNVTINDEEISCTCGDWSRNSKKDPNYRCKHILAVLNCVPLGDVANGYFLDKKRPRLDERWVIEIDGNQFVKYAGLLDLGHQKGISQIEVETLQLPHKDNANTAICKATVISKTGDSFTDIGDASPQSCNAKVAKHLLRLASTRAIARALRIFTNVGMTALEELADLNDVLGDGAKKGKPKTVKKTPKKSGQAEAKSKSSAGSVKPDKSDSKSSKGNGSENSAGPAKAGKSSQPNMSEAQKRAIHNLSRRRGITIEELEQMAIDAYGVPVENLNSKDASSFIRNLQQAA